MSRLEPFALATTLALPAGAAEPNGPYTLLEASRPLFEGVTNTDRATAEACAGWSMSKAQVERFFTLGELLDGVVLHHQFAWLPCSIEGRVHDGRGQVWNFRINAAATATTWRGDGPTREEYRWGCRREGCESLVLMGAEGDG